MPIPPDTRAPGDTGHVADHNNIADELTAIAGGAVTAGGDLTGTAGAAQVTGTHLASALPVAQGGTGQTAQAAALTALAGTQAAGKVLRSDGTNTALASLQPSDVPTLNQSTTGTAAGLSTTLAVGSGGTGSTTRNFAGLLTPAAVQTSAYSAAAGDFVPVDTTSGNVTITLPNAPPDLTVVAVKHVIQGGTNTVTFACAGSDVLNKTGGSTSGTLTLASQGVMLQYKAGSPGIWYVTADDLPLTQLDGRYPRLGTASTYTADQYFGSGRPWFDVVAYGADPTGVADSTAAFQWTINTALGLRTDTNVGFTAASTTVTNPAAVSGDNGLYLTSQNFPRTDTGCGTNTTTTVTDPSAQAGDLGCTITGTNIQPSTTITAVNPGVGYTISNAATGTTGSLTFTVIGGIGGYAHITAVDTVNKTYTVSVAATATLSAQTATVGTAAALTTRIAKGPMYIPAGTYKITSDLQIRSVQNFVLKGAGAGATRIKPAGTGFFAAAILVDGSLDGVFQGFEIHGDGTEQVTDAIRLDWTTAASRSTSANCFRDIRIRNTKFVVGLSLESNATRQVDGTILQNIVIAGGQAAGAWPTSGNWQKAFALGSGTFGNIYDTTARGCSAVGCYYGWYVNASGFSLYGSQPGANAIEFFIIPGAQTTISNIQSQSSGQFLVQTSAFSPAPVSVSDVVFVTSYSTSANVIDIYGGVWDIRNFCASSVLNGATIVPGVVNIRGAGANRPGVVTLTNLTLNNSPLTAAVTPAAGAANVVVKNFNSYDPVAGHYSAPVPLSYYTGSAWVTVGSSATPPDIKWITATGTTTWTKPAGAVTVFAILVGPGAGGGSGRRGAAGTIRCGGGGGGGGAVSQKQFAASDLTSTVTVTVGAGTSGGPAQTVDSTSGTAGSSGAATTFGSYLSAASGTPGQGGTLTTGSAGIGGVAGTTPGANGGAASTTGLAGGHVALSPGGAGGSSGGGITNGDVAGGGDFGATSCMGVGTLGGATASAGGAVDGAGGIIPTSGTQSTIQGSLGCGAGSGAASITTAAQAGANSVGIGAGGPGGGASLNGNNSGAGGNGGPGAALIISYFQ